MARTNHGNPASLVLDAALNIRDLESQYNLRLPRDEGFETLAGFVVAQLAAHPQVRRLVPLPAAPLHRAGDGRPPRGSRQGRSCPRVCPTPAQTESARHDPLLLHSPRLHAAGCLAGGQRGVSADPPGARRPHPGHARRRRCRSRHPGRAPRLRPRRSSGHPVRPLLEGRPPWRSRPLAASEQAGQGAGRARLIRPRSRSRFPRCSVAILLSIPAGVRSATRRNRWDDRALSFVSLLGLSFPNFALGPILIFSSPFAWTGCRSPAREAGAVWSCPPSPWAHRWPPS